MNDSKTSPANSRKILGIEFFAGSAAEAVQRSLPGGLVVVPAAPALVEMVADKSYREALLGADLVLTDSGFMVLVWNWMKSDRLRRVSGLEYLKLLLDQPSVLCPGAVLWVMPSIRSRDRNLAWLQSRGMNFTSEDCHVSPVYDRQRVEDAELLARVHQRRPRHIIVGLGGGTQEKLGLYLKQHCEYLPAIHCIGAAIGFLSGDQVAIPDWADRWYLGWLFRCISQPRRFIPRYLRALRLLSLLIRNQERLPLSSGEPLAGQS